MGWGTATVLVYCITEGPTAVVSLFLNSKTSNVLANYLRLLVKKKKNVKQNLVTWKNRNWKSGNSEIWKLENFEKKQKQNYSWHEVHYLYCYPFGTSDGRIDEAKRRLRVLPHETTRVAQTLVTLFRVQAAITRRVAPA